MQMIKFTRFVSTIGNTAANYSKYWNSVRLGRSMALLISTDLLDVDLIYSTSTTMIDRLIELSLVEIVAMFEQEGKGGYTSFQIKLTVLSKDKYVSISKTQIVNVFNRDALTTLFIKLLAEYVINNPDILIDDVLVNFHILDDHYDSKFNLSPPLNKFNNPYYRSSSINP
jgi:hypothetical protein